LYNYSDASIFYIYFRIDTVLSIAIVLAFSIKLLQERRMALYKSFAKKRYQEITAHGDRCSDWAACPAVYEEPGTRNVLVVGKKVPAGVLGSRVGHDEVVLSIEKGLLKRSASNRPVRHAGKRAGNSIVDPKPR
jgi:hypothetical protein